MLLSVGLMVKNESKYLEKCLQNLQPIIKAINSEIVIVDTGSTDNTVEIARCFTDKVYFHQWNNDFSEIRNLTVNYSKGEWFFHIDGDEIITNPDGIIHFFKSGKYKNYNTACVTIRNFGFSNTEEGSTVFAAPRIFRKDEDFHYEGAIHEQAMLKLPLVVLDSQMDHYGYLKDDNELMERKFVRNVEVLQNELQRDPDNIYYHFQLSQSYAAHSDYWEALESAKRAVDLIKKKKFKLKHYMYAYAQLVKGYMHNEKYAEAEEVCLEVLREDKTFIDIYFYLATSQFKLYKDKEAIKNYNIYLDKIADYGASEIALNLSTTVYTLYSYEGAYINLAIIYNRLGAYDKAVEYAMKVKSDKLSLDAFKIIISVYLRFDDYVKIKHYYEDSVLHRSDDLINGFLVLLETYLIKLPEDKRKKVYSQFLNVEDEYSALNTIRLGEIEKNEIYSIIRSMDFSVLPLYYSDILYYLLKNNVSLEEYLKQTPDEKIKGYLTHLSQKYRNLSQVIYSYLLQQSKDGFNFDTCRINKKIASTALLSQGLLGEQYKDIFFKYLDYGLYYLVNVYNESILDNDMFSAMKDNEDLFLMYLYKSRQHKENKVIYISYLRKALETHKFMKKGIQILLDNVQTEVSRQEDKLSEYRNKVKDTISQLSNAGKILEAKELVAEYESIIKNDIEIYSIKAILEMMENNYETAEVILKKGLQQDAYNFDILYNLGYLYENLDRLDDAYMLYNKARAVCTDEAMKRQVDNIINSLAT